MLEVLGDDKKLETRRAGKRILTEVGVTERLARASSRHPWRTILAWIGAIVVALVLAATLLPGNLTTNGHVTGNPQSKQAENLFQQRFPPDKNAVDELIVVSSAADTVNDPAFTSFLTHLRTKAAATGVVYRYSALGVSRDRHAMLIGVQRQADVDKLLSLVERDNGREGFSVVMTGGGTLDHDFNDLSQHDLKSGELEFGLPAALIILILVFGAVVAGLVPLLMAIVAIVVALGLCAPIAAAFSLSVFFVNMLTGMGLALGIDYSLFVVSRYREERAAGREELAAIAAAGATVEPRRALQRLGLRDRADRDAARALERDEEPRRRRYQRRHRVGAGRADAAARAAREARRPRQLAARPVHRPKHRERRGGALLGRRRASGDAPPGRLPAHLRRAADRPRRSGSRAEPRGERCQHAARTGSSRRRASRRSTRYFPQASASPALIAWKGTCARRRCGRRSPGCGRELGTDPVFGAQRRALRLGRRRWPPSASRSAATRPGLGRWRAIRHLRSTTDSADVPRHERARGVGGDTADNVDFIDAMNRWLPFVFVFVLGLSFVLLTIVFRSIVIAGTSIVLNLLSVGAAYGLVILVFRHGIGNGLLGFQRVSAIEAWVPLFLFSVLFGLSMDYQVFLLSRIKERYDATGSTTDAVTHAVALDRAADHRRGPDHRRGLLGASRGATSSCSSRWASASRSRC